MYQVSKNEDKMKQSEDKEKNIVEVAPIDDDKKAESNGDIKKHHSSIKRNSTTRASLAFINTAFVKDEAIEIVKELPTLHLEHVKL